MKCLVFSDSHGNTRNMRAALSAHPDAEVVFFLGDGLPDAELVSEDSAVRAWLAVRGNCDFLKFFKGTAALCTDEITLLGHKIVFTHGNLFGAKSGEGDLISLGESRGASLVLFGHTHQSCERFVREVENPFYLFNPGSIGAGRYGVIMLYESGILLSHGEANERQFN